MPNIATRIVATVEGPAGMPAVCKIAGLTDHDVRHSDESGQSGYDLAAECGACLFKLEKSMNHIGHERSSGWDFSYCQVRLLLGLEWPHWLW